MQQVKRGIKRIFSDLIYRSRKSAASREAILGWVKKFESDTVQKLADTSFDVFTYHGEDGIILYLLDHMKEVPSFFVDIGSGDCIKSNCASLAVHFGWEGLFIDRSTAQLSVGESFYKHKIKSGVKIKMIPEEIGTENVNQILMRESVKGEIGLLSIDIDGNDYWIWKAMDNINSRIVVIEAKVEFGFRNLVVPYGKNNHHSVDKMYNGASVEALRLLGKKKGYKLVGANKQGYNLFFVKEDESIPAVSTADILDEPLIKESFYPESFFVTHTFVQE